MKIYIVEDDENKGIKLFQFVKSLLPDAQLEIYKSLQSGLKAIKLALPDLVLLDMTIPNYDLGPDESGGQTHPFGGRELLRQLDRFDLVVPVIVVTQFETFGKAPRAMGLPELDHQLRLDHPDVYYGSVYYNAGIEGWKSELETLLRQSASIGDGS